MITTSHSIDILIIPPSFENYIRELCQVGKMVVGHKYIHSTFTHSHYIHSLASCLAVSSQVLSYKV